LLTKAVRGRLVDLLQVRQNVNDVVTVRLDQRHLVLGGLEYDLRTALRSQLLS